jgi:hypothetical protein
MAVNTRVIYAVQAVRLRGPSGTNVPPINDGWDRVHGLQSIGVNTNFNLEPIYQMGQLDVYDDYEEIPEVEISLNKVLDGFPLIYHMTMGTGTLQDVQDNRCGVQFGIWTQKDFAATGIPSVLLECEPAYLQSVTYNFGTDGNLTEDATIVSNSKVWKSTVSGTNWGGYVGSYSTSDDHWYPTPTGHGIMRRGNIDLGRSIFASGITTTSALSKRNAAPNTYQAGTIDSNKQGKGNIPPQALINSVTLTANLGREELRILGQRDPFIRYINFPLEITAEIEITAGSGDMANAATSNGCTVTKGLADQTIFVALCDGTTFDLGDKCKLTSVNHQGGDTGGGNATITYSYRTFSTFTVGYGTGYAPLPPDNTVFESMGGNQDFNFQDTSNP